MVRVEGGMATGAVIYRGPSGGERKSAWRWVYTDPTAFSKSEHSGEAVLFVRAKPRLIAERLVVKHASSRPAILFTQGWSARRVLESRHRHRRAVTARHSSGEFESGAACSRQANRGPLEAIFKDILIGLNEVNLSLSQLSWVPACVGADALSDRLFLLACFFLFSFFSGQI